ncbi:MAG: hypothetical protein QXF82_01535 [Nitrososphaeria archaeon]
MLKEIVSGFVVKLAELAFTWGVRQLAKRRQRLPQITHSDQNEIYFIVGDRFNRQIVAYNLKTGAWSTKGLVPFSGEIQKL